MIALAFLALLLGQADAGPWQRARLTVRAIAVTNGTALPARIDPRLDPIKPYLDRFGEMFRNRSVRLLLQQSFDLDWRAPAEVALPANRSLMIIPRALEPGQRIWVHFEVVATPQSHGLHTDYSIERGGTVLMGWLQVDPANRKSGKLLIAVTHEIER